MKLKPIHKWSIIIVGLIILIGLVVYDYKYLEELSFCFLTIGMITLIGIKPAYRWLLFFLFIIIATVILVYAYQYFEIFKLCIYIIGTIIILISWTHYYYKKRKK